MKKTARVRVTGGASGMVGWALIQRCAEDGYGRFWGPSSRELDLARSGSGTGFADNPDELRLPWPGQHRRHRRRERAYTVESCTKT